MRETNLYKLTHDYARHMERELAMTAQFGKRRAGVEGIIGSVKNAMGQGKTAAEWEQQVRLGIIDPLMGSLAKQPDGPWLAGFKRYQFVSKIAMNARLWAYQASQPFISAAGPAGLKRTMLAFPKVLKDAIFQTKDWELLKTSGAVAHAGVDWMMDPRFEDVRQTVVSKLLNTVGKPFRVMDAASRYVSATAGHGVAEDLVRYLKGEFTPGKRAMKAALGRVPLSGSDAGKAQAKRWLEEEVGIQNLDEIVNRTGDNGRWGGFTVEESKRVMTWFANRTNFTGNILDIPPWFRNTGAGKLLTMFGSFGYQQARTATRAGRKLVTGEDPWQAISLLGGGLLAGEMNVAIQGFFRGTPRQEDLSTTEGKIARVATDLVASSLLGQLMDVQDLSIRGFTPVGIIDPLLFVTRSVPSAISDAANGGTFWQVAQTLFEQHVPLLRQLKGPEYAATWGYEAATGEKTKTGDERAYHDVMGVYMHAQRVADSKTPWTKLKTELAYPSEPKGGIPYRAYLDGNRTALYQYLDERVESNQGDLTRLTDSLVASLWEASPMDQMRDTDAETAVRLSQRLPWLQEAQSRSFRHYLDFVNWTQAGVAQWVKDREGKYGWKAEDVLGRQGPLKVRRGPESLKDFEASKFYKTMPKEWRTLAGARPQSWAMPMQGSQFRGVYSPQTLDEIEALDAYQQYIPRAAMDKMFTLPVIKAYREKFPKEK
jgi:hypothetical protein